MIRPIHISNNAMISAVNSGTELSASYMNKQGAMQRMRQQQQLVNQMHKLRTEPNRIHTTDTFRCGIYTNVAPAILYIGNKSDITINQF